ncbi:nucleotide-binding protein [Acinetobacter colistiniresistens]|uniref:nucleotide-binding protein n=1 Tax=Acinetobacter colistiniresistens TaxID=280145 RepID=UPI0012501D36|nr:AAA family ATPase [Acinetobacter colistiniresistens]
MILVIANSKGGVGKTSLATSILAEIAKTKSVIGIDLDSANYTASSVWSSERTEEQGIFHPLNGEIMDDLLGAKEGYEEVVVDVGGMDTKEGRQAMLVADTILVPLRIGANSNIDSFRKTVDLIAEINQTRETPARVMGVITAAPHIGSNAELDRAIMEIVNEPTVEPAATKIGDRNWYGRAFDAFQGITEYTSPSARDRGYVDKAKAEFKGLFKEIYGE